MPEQRSIGVAIRRDYCAGWRMMLAMRAQV
jgi:hypothetical protein